MHTTMHRQMFHLTDIIKQCPGAYKYWCTDTPSPFHESY